MPPGPTPVLPTPAQNRVTPLGDVVAATGRGAWMGNRGRLHEGSGSRVVVRHHRSRAWITCVLSFRGHRAPQWAAHHYTPLFFLDEAVALAAGHRPCAECRWAAYREFSAAVARFLGTGRLGAAELDRHLHEQRWDPTRRTRRLHPAPWPDLPEGAFVLVGAGAALVRADHLRLWRSDNTYGDHLDRPTTGLATAITPPATLAVLRGGYPVQLGDDPTPAPTAADRVSPAPPSPRDATTRPPGSTW
ncbi:hypothetical protein [Intrasporangium sp.]|uniref:hypothetical protein n=1 Tax=Intrasporangium sp. TaxID=1925024 RepID=UPI0032220B1C